MNPQQINAQEETPQLVYIKDQLSQQVERVEVLSMEINSRLQGIKTYSEPEPPKPTLSDTPFICFTEEMIHLITRLQNHNDRLEFSVRHLQKLL